MSILPTAKTAPKPNLADLTVLAYGQTKIGKCLSGDTEIVNPLNGRIQTIRSLVEDSRGSVLTMKEAGRIEPVTPDAFIENAPAQLYRLSTG